MISTQPLPQSGTAPAAQESAATERAPAPKTAPKEIGGRDGPEPTRYGDWEKNGRCVDF